MLRSEQLDIQLLDGTIDFDGYVNEQAWENIAPLPMVQYAPVFGKDPSEKSEIRVTYNNEYIYHFCPTL